MPPFLPILVGALIGLTIVDAAVLPGALHEPLQHTAPVELLSDALVPLLVPQAQARLLPPAAVQAASAAAATAPSAASLAASPESETPPPIATTPSDAMTPTAGWPSMQPAPRLLTSTPEPTGAPFSVVASLVQKIAALVSIVSAQQEAQKTTRVPEHIAASGNGGPAVGGYILGGAVGNTPASITSLAASAITGTLTNVINSALATIDDLTASELVAVNASSTNLFAGTASMTSLTLANLSGFLKATAGAVATALIDLASDVTGVLSVANGGTGWANIASAAIPYGNGAGALATTTAGTNGQILALLNGVPTWAATSTLSTITGTLDVSKGGSGATSFSYGLVLSPGGAAALTNIATSSLGLLTTNVAEGSNLYYLDSRVQSFIHGSTTIPKTYASNIFAGGNLFLASTTIGAGGQATGLTISGGATTTGNAYFAGNVGIGTTTPASLFSIQDIANFQLGTSTLYQNLNVLGQLKVGTDSIFLNGAATSTFTAGIQTSLLNITSTGASSTFANGINLTGGCFAVNGTCMSAGSGSGTVSSGTQGQFAFYNANGTTVSGTSTLFLLQNTNFGIGTSTPLAKATVYGDLFLDGADRYINFGATSTIGSSGYGFRDNSGVMEFKNAGGTWAGVSTATTGPSFSVHRNGVDQTLSNNTVTAIDWTTETFDTNNNFDLSTDRFTPTVPGQYVLSLSTFFSNPGDTAYLLGYIYKNGTVIARGMIPSSAANSDPTPNATIVVNANGTTDYFEARAFQVTGGSFALDGNSTGTYFTGAMIAPVNGNNAAGWANDGTQSFLLDNADKVGVGTSTPWALLSVNPNGITGPAFAIGSSTATHFIVTNSGNVGIGTATPSVAVDMQATLSSGIPFKMSNRSTAAGADHLQIQSNIATPDSGVVFISFGDSAGSNDGTISATGAGGVAYNTTSDRRLKENIATSTLGLDALMRLSVREFNFIQDPTHATTTGFIAQELYEIYPWAVSTNGDDGTEQLSSGASPWGVDYGRITPLLAQSIQDLNWKLEELATTTPEIDGATFTSRFFSSLFTRITQWLADTANGITDLVATTIRAHRVVADELCVGSVCVTQSEFLAMVAAANASPPPSASGANNATPQATLAVNGNDPQIWTLNTPWQDNLGALFAYGAGSETVYSTSTVDTTIIGTTTIDYWATWYTDPASTTSAQMLHATRAVVVTSDTPVPDSDPSPLPPTTN